MSTQNETTSQNLLTGLSALGGLGLTMMILAPAVGVVDMNIDSNTVGLIVLTGFLMLASAITGWFFIVQPHKHFDDINIPAEADHGHGHDEEADDAAQH